MTKVSASGSVIDTLLNAIDWKPVPHNPEVCSQVADLPFVTYEGKLEIAGKTLRCYQLSDGRRIVDAEDMSNFLLGMPGTPRNTQD